MSGVHVKTETQISHDTEQTSLPCVDGTKRQQLITRITEDGKIKRCELGCVCVFLCVSEALTGSECAILAKQLLPFTQNTLLVCFSLISPGLSLFRTQMEKRAKDGAEC